MKWGKPTPPKIHPMGWIRGQAARGPRSAPLARPLRPRLLVDLGIETRRREP